MGAAEWWSKINSSSQMIEDILKSVKKRNSVVVNVFGAPFTEEFVEIMRSSLYMNDSENSFELIDDSESSIAVEELLFGRYCPSDVANEYFPTPNNSKAKFIAHCKQFSLNSSTAWVRLSGEKRANEWLDFIKEYSENCDAMMHAVFVLQINSESLQPVKTRNISSVFAKDYITPYDYYVYYMLETAQIPSYSALKKRYLAELLASFCANDVATAERMFGRREEILERPVELYSECSGADIQPAELQSRLWRAQMRVLFPEIEDFRYRIVQKYIDEIQAALPFPTVYKTEINEPFELDLGNILSMSRSGNVILQSNDVDKMKNYKSIRDNLAHMKTSSYNDVKKML